MRRTGWVWGGVILVVSTVIAGCASDRGFRCGGDLVRINPPTKMHAVQKPKRTERRSHAGGDSP